MKAKCIQNGLAYLVGVKKPQWVEAGQEHDLDVEKMGGMPPHFEAVSEPAAKKVATKKAPGAPATVDL